MAFGSFVVRVAPGPDKSKWKVEIHKTARAALTAARGYAKPTGRPPKTPQVCVFDMSKWSAKPVCLAPAGSWDARRKSGTIIRRKHERVRYQYAPSKIPADRPGGRLKRLAWDKDHWPVVKYDGYAKKSRKGRK